MLKARITASLILASMVGASISNATVIDFDTTPSGGTPTDNAFLAAPYTFTEGDGGSVRFFFDTNGDNLFENGIDRLPVFEQVGNDFVNGFYNNATNQYDVANPGFESQLGNFFIRNENFPLFPLIVAYDTPNIITSLFGEIWDIDADAGGFEQWRVEVLNSASSVLATLDSPAGVDNSKPLDGRPWSFDFNGLPADSELLRITFIGSKINNAGLGFNNFGADFSTSQVPEAGSVSLLAAAGALFGGVILRRKKSQPRG